MISEIGKITFLAPNRYIVEQIWAHFPACFLHIDLDLILLEPGASSKLKWKAGMTLLFMNRNDNEVCILGLAAASVVAKVVRSWLGDCMSCLENPWPDVARLGFRWWLPIWQFCTTPLAWRVTSLTFQAFQLKTPDPWEEDARSTNTWRWGQPPPTKKNLIDNTLLKMEIIIMRRLYDFFHQMKRERWTRKKISPRQQFQFWQLKNSFFNC